MAKFHAPIDLLLNELKNARIELSTSPPSITARGHIYFNTTDLTLYIHDGSTWIGLSKIGHGNESHSVEFETVINKENLSLLASDPTIKYPTVQLVKTAIDALTTWTSGELNDLDALIANKVDIEVGKGLSTNDFTTAEKAKLANIETEANKYIHPVNHPASMITQDASNRFVTDAEKTTWNAKASTAVVTTTVNGLMSYTDKVKLNGIADNANNYVHPASHAPSIITQDASNRFVTDVEKATWNAKASTDIATTSVNGLMSSGDKTKLDGIATGANNYTHPANHPASIITQDTNNRFVTDAEKTAWNAKASTDIATTLLDGLMSSEDKTKLDGIATGANNYVHPASHAPSIITQDANNRFVTDAEKTTWNAKASTAVATTSVAGLMSAGDKTKLDGIATGAQANQNAFSHIAISGQNTVSADSATDTLTLVAGTNVTITTNDTTDTITISAVDTTYTASTGIELVGNDIRHADTSSQTSVNNSGRTYIQDITLDAYGHITAITSATETVVDTNTTYDISAVTTTGGAFLRLNAGGSGSGTDDVKFASGSNVTVAYTDASTITISAVDTIYTHPTYNYTPTTDAVTTLSSVPFVSTITQTNGHVTGSTHRKLVAGANTTITASADGNITIASSDTIYTHPTQTAIDTNASDDGISVVDRVQVNTLGHVTAVSTRNLSNATTSVAGVMSAADKTKLDGIAAGAEVNVQSDWTAVSGDAFILNKPTLGTAAALNTGTTNGTIPIIGANNKLDISVIPASVITDTFVVASQVEMLALSTAEPGDIAIRTDLNKTFILQTAPYSTLLNWKELLTPTDSVTSVAGKTGVVTLVANDVGLGNVTNESKATMFTSPTFTGTPLSTTAAVGTNTTQIATTAFVNAEIANDAAPIAHVGATGTAHGVATTSVHGFMSSTDKTKLDGIATGAQANQNAFSNIAVSGQSTVAADSATDTLTLVGGANVTITTDAGTDTVTISAVDTIYTHPTYSYSATANTVTTLASIPLISDLTVTNGHVSASTHRKLVAGTNVSITPAADGNITIAATDTNTATAADNILKGSNSGTQITYAPYATNEAASATPRFYTTANNPTGTSRLNVSAYMYATQVFDNGVRVATIDRQIIAGNGLTGGGTLAADRTVTLGTPSAITQTSINEATSTSHTHAITGFYNQTESDSRYVNAAGDTMSGDLIINGTLYATAKSFLIKHPTKPELMLKHGSLEGPENGVYFRGKSNNSIIELPEYWEHLVDMDTITVNLTPIGKFQKLYVEKIVDNKVYIKQPKWFKKPLNYSFIIYAERKDTPKLDVETKMEVTRR